VVATFIVLELGKKAGVFVGRSDHNVVVSKLCEVTGVTRTCSTVRLERSRHLRHTHRHTENYKAAQSRVQSGEKRNNEALVNQSVSGSGVRWGRVHRVQVHPKMSSRACIRIRRLGSRLRTMSLAVAMHFTGTKRHLQPLDRFLGS